MTDYDALIKSLRTCVEKDKGCDDCPYMVRCLKSIKEPFIVMTDAADAIEELQKYKSIVDKGLGLHEKAQELLDALRPRWISVTERLPEDHQQKIVCHIGGVSLAYWNMGHWCSSLGKTHYLKTVTHWMPLPAPPKDETE